MNVLTCPDDVRDALRGVQPVSIAVAYVGAKWKDFVSTKRLREIILSPTLGSNPFAIEELMDVLGHDNVHFLDALHSKIYLGASSVLLGSCNLSQNGMSNHGRLEAAVILTDNESRQQLAAQIQRYKESARKAYPCRQKKIEQLRALKLQWNKAQWFGLTPIASTSPSIADYKSNLDRIHIAWYGSEKPKLARGQINRAIPDTLGIKLDDYFSGWLQFRAEDDVQPGDWILCWRCNDDGLPRKGGDISWMYAHHVVPNGVNNKDHPKLVGETKVLRRPSPPFILDPSTKTRIRRMLASRDFPSLLLVADLLWPLGPADEVTPQFIDALRKAAVSGRLLRGNQSTRTRR